MSIIVKDITKAFDGQVVFDKLNMEFADGRVNVLMGKSGQGKTTLLRILMGLEKIDEGSILGLENKKLSVVFQENRLCENLTAEMNLKLVKDLNKDEINELLSAMSLDSQDKKPVREYSGGMQRRVAIARALAADYDVLIMDEPLKGLDEETKALVVEGIKKYSENKTVIMVTHDAGEGALFDANVLRL